MQGLINNTSLKILPIVIKKISYILPFLSFLAAHSSYSDEPSKSSLPIIAITQIVQHGSLDQEYKGILSALKDAGYEDGKTMKLVFANAQGNLSTASLIADQFTSIHPSVVIAISTPSAQTLVKPMRDREVPLVFTAVTDPLEAKLVTTLSTRPEGVTGVSDALSPGPQLDLVLKLVPHAQNIGVVYNSGETNSAKAVQQLQEEATKRGLTLVTATADKSSEILSSTTKLVGKVDAIYVPNDNTAVASIEIIAQLGKKFKIPVFAGDVGSVERGAVAAQAYDRVVLGKAAGDLAVKILKGKKAGDLAIETDHPLLLMVNLKAAEEMGVTIPNDVKDKAKLIGETS